ncbi:MAG: hypothetical protein IKW50_02390 [Oscillospiraceae bacterium]|nr:hypothetical protein [Oscillospiraceae bacterium]
MKEVEKNEQLENPTVKETPESAKEAESKKAQFGNSLDSFSSTGTARRQEGTVTKPENNEDRTDNTKIAEVKTGKQTAETKKQEFGAKLENLSSTGTVKENTEDAEAKKDVSATKIDDKVTDIEKEKLPNFLADTFKDGEYRTVVTDEDIKLYRTYGGKSEIGGSFATTEASRNEEETRQECAILPEWNDCTHEVEITVPKGTKLNIGTAEAQEDETDGTIYEGGGDQVLLPQNWAKEHPEWITNIRTLKENSDD